LGDVADRSPHPRRGRASGASPPPARRGLLPPERERAWRVFDQVQTDFRDLERRCEQELTKRSTRRSSSAVSMSGLNTTSRPSR
jgi:hypothetical protein